MRTRPRRPDARCPLRPGEPCTLCEMGATGPQDCPLVYLVMTDEELRAGVHDAAVRALTRAAAGEHSGKCSPARDGGQS